MDGWLEGLISLLTPAPPSPPIPNRPTVAFPATHTPSPWEWGSQYEYAVNRIADCITVQKNTENNAVKTFFIGNLFHGTVLPLQNITPNEQLSLSK